MKALITLLILGTSSVALARPITVDHRDDSYYERDHRDDSYYERDHRDDNLTVRDHRDDMTFAPPPATQPAPPPLDYRADYRPLRFRLRPVTLAHSVTLMRQRNRDQRPLLIDVDSRTGTFKTLRLDRIEGRAYIDDIVVVLANGRSITYDVNQQMSFRSPSITIDLDHKAITGIYVYGMTERGRATFDVIGLRR